MAQPLLPQASTHYGNHYPAKKLSLHHPILQPCNQPSTRLTVHPWTSIISSLPEPLYPSISSSNFYPALSSSISLFPSSPLSIPPSFLIFHFPSTSLSVPSPFTQQASCVSTPSVSQRPRLSSVTEATEGRKDLRGDFSPTWQGADPSAVSTYKELGVSPSFVCAFPYEAIRKLSFVPFSH